ncbi:PIN domain-containing protein [Streptacidiphilus jiangxiensis]|uniref:PIN domain nuclease, a component of toxin-antitoxin system (PIN domain) n=1 Tax=Streptacidiphilus jiangxiensis TaxID=235985 RepID=A0A1H7WKH5_STRJI|nr:PIN domain-containing protein [Streptacidiphilus jiangxiensis]SEM21397.1 PIN domain nuclease, a component of toxin-antitoxin system (PIN domain) [Streptacidiphilus jiangxiensis]
MTSSSLRAVPDASAVLAFVFDEQGAHAVEQLLPVSAIGTDNLTEVLVRCHARGYQRTGQELAADLQALGLQVVNGTTADQAARAAELVHLSKLEKDKHNGRTLARGDGQALALAERLGLPVVTGDTLWTELQHLVQVQIALFR